LLALRASACVLTWQCALRAQAEDRPAYNVLLQTIAGARAPFAACALRCTLRLVCSRARCAASEAQEQAEQAAAAAAAPVHTFAHWADLPPPVPQPIHARGFEPAVRSHARCIAHALASG
jgi:hypothetical protein